MKYILTMTSAFLLLLLAMPPAFAQAAGMEWDTLNKKVMELHPTGKAASRNNMSNCLVQLADWLAVWRINHSPYSCATPNYDSAVIIAMKTLEVAQKNVGPKHPNVATSLNNLAE